MDQDDIIDEQPVQNLRSVLNDISETDKQDGKKISKDKVDAVFDLDPEELRDQNKTAG